MGKVCPYLVLFLSNTVGALIGQPKFVSLPQGEAKMLERSTTTALGSLPCRGDVWGADRITATREALINSKSFYELLEAVGATDFDDGALTGAAGSGGLRLDPTGSCTSRSRGCFWFGMSGTKLYWPL